MTDYRRNRIPGGTYFSTVNLPDRRSDLLIRHIHAPRSVVRERLTKAPLHIDAWVVLPDHMHCMWTLPPRDADFSTRWQAIKIGFSKRVPPEERR
jgi:putative transposase